MAKQRFLFTAQIERAEGSQTFYVDADTQEEAMAALKNGGGDIYSQEVEVVSLSSFEFEQITSTDDYGDYPPSED